MGKLGQIIK